MIFLSSCGGGTGEDQSQPSAGTGEATATVATDTFAKRAEAVCRQSLAETRDLGRRLPQIFAESKSFPQQTVTSGLVKPGVAILGREAARMRELGTPASQALQSYVGLFEPIVELGNQRLDVGAGEIERVHGLEQLIAELENEQSAFARRSGLKACAISFNRALAQSG